MIKLIKLSRLNRKGLSLISLTTGLLLSSAVMSAQAAEQVVTIGALASGQVTQLYVKEGDSVKAGQKLLTLDAERYQAKLAVLKSQLKMAKFTMDDTKIELDQALDLYDRTVTSKRTLDASQLRYDNAKAAYDKANAEIALHRAWGKYVYVKAPVAGTINKIHTPLGSTVFKENTPMVEIQP